MLYEVITKALERERFYRYITGFGFGAKSGIDLPGEVTGLVRKPSQWFEVDLAAISFGQGITVTPLQLAAATAAIANGGNLMAPYVVERVVNSYGEIEERTAPRVVRRVVRITSYNVCYTKLLRCGVREDCLPAVRCRNNRCSEGAGP